MNLIVCGLTLILAGVVSFLVPFNEYIKGRRIGKVDLTVVRLFGVLGIIGIVLMIIGSINIGIIR